MFITCCLNLSFLQNHFWLHLCAKPIWIFCGALGWNSICALWNTIKDLPFPAFSMVNTLYSLLSNFGCDQNHQFFARYTQREFIAISAIYTFWLPISFQSQKISSQFILRIQKYLAKRRSWNLISCEYQRLLRAVERKRYFVSFTL